MVARYLGVVEAVGSNPATQTKKGRFVRVSLLVFNISTLISPAPPPFPFSDPVTILDVCSAYRVLDAHKLAIPSQALTLRSNTISPN